MINLYRCTKKIKLWSQLHKGSLSLTRVNLESVFLFLFTSFFSLFILTMVIYMQEHLNIKLKAKINGNVL